MNKMIRAYLIEVPTGRAHDLTALLEIDDEISIGRENTNRIQLGIQGKIRGNITWILSLLGLSKTRKNLLTVSRQHAYIKEHKGKICIKDSNSRNGTKVNGIDIGYGAQLNHGDEVKFGAYPTEYKEIYVPNSIYPTQ